jgi:RNase P/RNase MRP subunit p29
MRYKQGDQVKIISSLNKKMIGLVGNIINDCSKAINEINIVYVVKLNGIDIGFWAYQLELYYDSYEVDL